MTSLVFFGAGASKPFGIPTMQEMVLDFENMIKYSKALYDFYSKIKGVLAQGYSDSVDIESVLSVVNGISENTKPAELGHFTFYYASQNCSNMKFTDSQINLAIRLKEELQQYVKDKCKIDGQQHNDIYAISYLPLFTHMPGKKKKYMHATLCRDWKAYTTNYDSVFEGFWRAFEPAIDHFKPIGDSDRHVFHTDLLQSDRTISKLHGSLDWTKEVSSGKIVRERSSTFSPVETKGEVMLFPIQQKELYLHPWFTLFQDLKIGLSTTQEWYVIGYAFNDEFIRNAFQESLVDNSSKTLILINPNANEIKNKFLQHVWTQIHALPIKFGSEFFDLQFRDYAENVKTVVMRLNTTSLPRGPIIKIECSNVLKSAKILNDNPGFKLDPNVDDQGRIHVNDQNYIHIETPNQQQEDVEVKLALAFDYNYGDEVELHVYDNTKTPDFSIWYGDKMIFTSRDADQENLSEDGHAPEKITARLYTQSLYV